MKKNAYFLLEFITSDICGASLKLFYEPCRFHKNIDKTGSVKNILKFDFTTKYLAKPIF